MLEKFQKIIIFMVVTLGFTFITGQKVFASEIEVIGDQEPKATYTAFIYNQANGAKLNEYQTFRRQGAFDSIDHKYVGSVHRGIANVSSNLIGTTLLGCDIDFEKDYYVLAYVNYSKNNVDFTKAVQKVLMAKGYFVGNTGADGKFGYNTDQAVAKFQRNNGLVVDGVVGKATYHALANKGK